MYLGVDYYPEHWPLTYIDKDMSLIKHMGANIIRIGEFAWHLIEKEEGKYDFSFFDDVIKKAKKYGLKVIFGTPTATFPAWLYKKYPSIVSKDEYGHIREFGGRRLYCFNSKPYLKYSTKLVEKLVNHYRDEETIISWQIDNEFGHEGSDQCFCEECEKEFRLYLKDKYKVISEFNKTSGTVFWGQTYNDFYEVPLPKPTITTHNPTLKLEHAKFRSKSINEFAKNHIHIVRECKGAHQSVTHNYFGGFFHRAYDQNILSKELNVVSYDNYPVWGGLKKPIKDYHIAMTLDYIRGLKQENFWIVEQIMGAQGHDYIGYLPRPNQGKMWAYQAMAHGCESMLFFRYRTMNKGAEQYCLGIIDWNNKIGRKYYEAQSFMKDIKNYKELIKTSIKSSIGILYDYSNIWSWKGQAQSSSFDFTSELLRLYRPFYELNTNIDVISTDKSFNEYKVLVVPVMTIIDEKLASRLLAFEENGGTLLFSFRAGLKDENNNIYFNKRLPNFISKIAGIEINESEPLGEELMIDIIGECEYKNKVGKCTVWRDLIDVVDAEVLYRYDDKFYRDKACITKKNNVYYIGAGVDNKTIDEIAYKVIKENNIEHIISPKNLEIYIRYLNDERWLFINNHSDEHIKWNHMTIKAYDSKIIKG